MRIGVARSAGIRFCLLLELQSVDLREHRSKPELSRRAESGADFFCLVLPRCRNPILGCRCPPHPEVCAKWQKRVIVALREHITRKLDKRPLTPQRARPRKRLGFSNCLIAGKCAGRPIGSANHWREDCARSGECGSDVAYFHQAATACAAPRTNSSAAKASRMRSGESFCANRLPRNPPKNTPGIRSKPNVQATS